MEKKQKIGLIILIVGLILLIVALIGGSVVCYMYGFEVPCIRPELAISLWLISIILTIIGLRTLVTPLYENLERNQIAGLKILFVGLMIILFTWSLGWMFCKWNFQSLGLWAGGLCKLQILRDTFLTFLIIGIILAIIGLVCLVVPRFRKK